MALLSDVVLISIVCAVTVFLSILLVTILCLRYRRKNILHSNGPNSNLYPQSRGLFHSTFPFSNAGARQWSAISSTENIRGQVSSPAILEPAPCHTSERRSSRMSTLSSRNSRRLHKKSSRDIPLESVPPPCSYTGPSDVANIDSSPRSIAELQADCIPKRKPPLPHDDTTNEDAGARITSWPLTRKGSYYDITATMRGGPYLVDSELSKRRSEWILRQVPGSPPKHDVPPLPALRPPVVPDLTRQNSMLLSNKSLDTAGSSILDDPVRESLNDSVDLETAREPYPRTHERYTSTGGWWLSASAAGGPVSRIPPATSPRRYSSTSTSSYRNVQDHGSPRRSASMHYPEKSSHILGVQSPTSICQLHAPSPGVSRSLTSGPWIQTNTSNRMGQLPTTNKAITSSIHESGCRLDQPHSQSAILKPITENGKNCGTRQLSNANGCASKRAQCAAGSSRVSTRRKISIDEEKKGHQRRKSVRLSVCQQNPIPTSLSPTIEELEESSCKSTPPPKAVTPTRQINESSELPPSTEDSKSPFDNDEQNLADDEGGEPTPTPIDRGVETKNLSTPSPSSVLNTSQSPTDERPGIPRRSSLRRITSTSVRSQHQAQSQPARSTSVTSTITTTPTSEHHASAPSTTTSTHTVSSFPVFESHANNIANVDKDARNLNRSGRPTRNAFALPENSELEEETSGGKKPRPLPVLPIPKVSQPPSRSRAPKFRVALTTIKSVSNIAMHDEPYGGCCEGSDKENGGNATTKCDDGSETPTPKPSPSQYHQLGKEEAGARSSIQQEGTKSPSDRQKRSAAPPVSTPLKAGTGLGAEQLTSSIVRTPGSMYDQFGFLKE
ncbi:uncharacterized protein BDCG_04259 [Blastomyces dermatitidis ER-3]|uniref:Uncharacterized protein n=2 Tax=Ajellomyces dermatitidis TaxID=5039 RepID=F2TE74_AJEDA|nr:uncharacterized protein BDCG_04259 [Blastomyces dermatitidis ER-3]EEQ89139.2 hypothetical protein BDCG_04259 [Blastomyces dermatitidis ER-3]EGE81537.1 hypothetical protein BDDG_04479 [Blastomyces dermatitidis ATCC 18188]EQL31700.1 hypothetical protein BDFG_05931 [Blastomyces dermatitidis ATCC 26199]